MLSARTPDDSGTGVVVRRSPKYASTAGHASSATGGGYSRSPARVASSSSTNGANRSFSHSVSLGLPSSLALAVAACENDAREAALILSRLPKHARSEIVNRRVWCDSHNKMLLAERPPERLDDPEIYEATMLGLASLGGSVEMVRLLLEAGADPAAKDSRGRTPLMCTIFAPVDSHEINATNLNYATLCLPKHLDVAEVLLDALAQSPIYHDVVNSTQNGEQLRGITPLCLAAYLGKLALCDALLASGAEVDCGDENGATPLMYAARDGHVEVTKLLLSYNARPDLIDRYGWSPIRYSAPFPEVLELLEQAAVEQKLSNVDVQSLFRNAEYMVQEIDALTGGDSGYRANYSDYSRRTSPDHSRAPTPIVGGGLMISGVPGMSPLQALPFAAPAFTELPPLAELVSTTRDNDLPINDVENLFIDLEKLELELRAVESQRNRLEQQLVEKDRQLHRMATTSAAIYSAYCRLVDHVNVVLSKEEAEAAVGDGPEGAVPIFAYSASDSLAAAAAAPTTAAASSSSALPVPDLLKKQSMPNLAFSVGASDYAAAAVAAASQLPDPSPRSPSLSIGSSSGKPALAPKSSPFNFRSPLQLLSKDKDGEQHSLSSLLGFGKSSKTKSPKPLVISSPVPISVPPTASAAMLSVPRETIPVESSATQQQEPAAVATVETAAADASPATALEEDYVERRKKKRQAPILVEYSPATQEVATSSEPIAAPAEVPPRFSSRPLPAVPETLSILDWNGSSERSSLILGSPSEIFAAVGLDPLPEPSQPEAAVEVKRSSAEIPAITREEPPALPFVEPPRPKRAREPLQPIVPAMSANMILEARQRLAPVAGRSFAPSKYSVAPSLTQKPITELKSAIDRLKETSNTVPVPSVSTPSENRFTYELKPVSPRIELTATTSPVLSVSPALSSSTSVAAPSPAPATEAPPPIPKKKRPVRRAPPRAGTSDFGNLYAYSGVMDDYDSGNGTGNPAALVDQISFSFKELKNL